MKKQILSKLQKIENLVNETGIQGNVIMEFTGISLHEWDSIVESITEYPRNQHFVQISEKFTVALLLG